MNIRVKSLRKSGKRNFLSLTKKSQINNLFPFSHKRILNATEFNETVLNILKVNRKP